jgi:hypothetical protein
MIKTKIKLLAILLISLTTELKSQYNPDFSTSTFYNSNSSKDLHYHQGWTRDTSGMQIVNSEMEISIFNNSTYALNTGFLTLSPGDIIYIDHRITNSSSNADLKISYVDDLGNEFLAKTINYGSANTQTLTDTVNVSKFGSYKIKLSYTKENGNNSQRFIIQDFSILNPVPLPIRSPENRGISSEPEIEEEGEIEVYTITGQKVFTGYREEFLPKAEKGRIYIIKGEKFIIQ